MKNGGISDVHSGSMSHTTTAVPSSESGKNRMEQAAESLRLPEPDSIPPVSNEFFDLKPEIHVPANQDANQNAGFLLPGALKPSESHRGDSTTADRGTPAERLERSPIFPALEPSELPSDGELQKNRTLLMATAARQPRNENQGTGTGVGKIEDKHKNYIHQLDVTLADEPSDQAADESSEKIPTPAVKQTAVKKTDASQAPLRETGSRGPEIRLRRIPESQVESSTMMPRVNRESVGESSMAASRHAAPPASPAQPEIVSTHGQPLMNTDTAAALPAATRAEPAASASSMNQVYSEKIAQMQESVSRQIVRAVQGSLGSQRSQVNMRLVPESLGHIVVRMTLENNQLTTQISAEKHATRALLEQHIAALRSAFDDQGIRVERLTIAQDSLDSKQQDSAKNDSPSGQSGRSKPDTEDNRSGRDSSGGHQSRRNPNPHWKDRFTAMDYYS